jgi:hypothetical protein
MPVKITVTNMRGAASRTARSGGDDILLAHMNVVRWSPMGLCLCFEFGVFFVLRQVMFQSDFDKHCSRDGLGPRHLSVIPLLDKDTGKREIVGISEPSLWPIALIRACAAALEAYQSFSQTQSSDTSAHAHIIREGKQVHNPATGLKHFGRASAGVRHKDFIDQRAYIYISR